MSVGLFLNAGEEIAVRLRRTCEAHDPSIDPHLDRVASYSCEIGRLLGFSEIRIMELRLAAPLHDIGKIGLPLTILNKPGRLTPEEMELVRTHTVLGHRILDGSPWPLIQCAARIARSHHESWDGKGGPDGLAGDQIPLEARIVAIADVFDALTSQRVYKAAWDHKEAQLEMRGLRGKKLDPAILDLFLEHLPRADEASVSGCLRQPVGGRSRP
jgi:putative two-component system response regulator